MKKLENSENKTIKHAKAPKRPDETNAVHSQLDEYEKEKHILLALSNAITKVREKSDLINLFSSGLNGFFYK